MVRELDRGNRWTPDPPSSSPTIDDRTQTPFSLSLVIDSQKIRRSKEIEIRQRGPKVIEEMRRNLVKDLISSKSFIWRWEKTKPIKQWREYVLFCPIFWKALSFFPRVYIIQGNTKTQMFDWPRRIFFFNVDISFCFRKSIVPLVTWVKTFHTTIPNAVNAGSNASLPGFCSYKRRFLQLKDHSV